MTGNLLLRFVQLLAQASVIAKILGIAEHPATCHWRPQAAIIWRLEEVQRLKAQGAQVVTFDQCVLGGRSRKPTQLLLIEAPHIKAQLLSEPHSAAPTAKIHRHGNMGRRCGDRCRLRPLSRVNNTR